MAVYTVHPHNVHIERLKELKKKGYGIIVWSQSGSEWADIIVNILDLEGYVDLIVPKPERYYDDLPSHIFMGHPCYLVDFLPLKDQVKENLPDNAKDVK